MKKIAQLILLLISINISSFAQDETLVKECINGYLDGITQGNAEKLTKSFHPQAMLRTVNATTAKMQEIPVAKFISGTPQGGVQAKTNLISYSLIGQSAVAAVDIVFADFKYVDYLSLLKFGNEWKIVCRVFSKAEITEQPINGGKVTASAVTDPKQAGKKAAKPKVKTDDGW
jgi:hypothetical protein